jgi:proline iminopeptidase
VPAATTNGTTLHYEVDGDRRPCVVLHGGLGVDHQVYRRTLEPLTDTLQLVYVDHRGNGRSAPVDMATVTMEQLADDVAALADELGLERFLVLGHSYGGFIAQEFALRHHDRLDGLILVATTPGQLGRDESPGDEQGPPPPPEFLALASSSPDTDDEVAAGMIGLLPYYLHSLEPVDVAPLLEGTIYRADVTARGFEVLAGWSSFDRLGDITAPTLLLAGRHDVFTSVPQSYRIARRLADAEVVVLEQSGHFPWLEEPDACFAAVRDWVGRKLRNVNPRPP